MRILEAPNILESATVECKTRDINTPEVRQALDLIEPSFAGRCGTSSISDIILRRAVEGQQQNLRVNFSGIHRIVRQRLIARLGWLGARYCKTKNPTTKAEINRLKAVEAPIGKAFTCGCFPA